MVWGNIIVDEALLSTLSVKKVAVSHETFIMSQIHVGLVGLKDFVSPC